MKNKYTARDGPFGILYTPGDQPLHHETAEELLERRPELKKSTSTKLTADNPALLKTIKVSFHGVEYWLIEESYPGGGRAIAPLDHCDSRGEILDAFADSYAHLCSDGVIRRYNKEIGRVGDLEVV